MKKLHKDRLLKVARALRESAAPADFSMRAYVNNCGTPACALGHYVARRDLQKSYTLVMTSNPLGQRRKEIQDSRGECQDYVSIGSEHFGLALLKANELFGVSGCGNAKTPEEAVQYIERFVARQP